MLSSSALRAESPAAEETYRPGKDLLPIIQQEIELSKARIELLELSLNQVREGLIRTPYELEQALGIGKTGESTSPDDLDDFPEISAFSGYDFGSKKIITGMGVEIFAKNKNWKKRSDRNRKGDWKWELNVADSFVGISGGKITVPVINFRVGPFVGYNFEDDNASYGLCASIFDF